MGCVPLRDAGDHVRCSAVRTYTLQHLRIPQRISLFPHSFNLLKLNSFTQNQYDNRLQKNKKKNTTHAKQSPLQSDFSTNKQKTNKQTRNTLYTRTSMTRDSHNHGWCRVAQTQGMYSELLMTLLIFISKSSICQRIFRLVKAHVRDTIALLCRQGDVQLLGIWRVEHGTSWTHTMC